MRRGNSREHRPTQVNTRRHSRRRPSLDKVDSDMMVAADSTDIKKQHLHTKMDIDQVTTTAEHNLRRVIRSGKVSKTAQMADTTTSMKTDEAKATKASTDISFSKTGSIMVVREAVMVNSMVKGSKCTEEDNDEVPQLVGKEPFSLLSFFLEF